jgi:hypothetical protein
MPGSKSSDPVCAANPEPGESLSLTVHELPAAPIDAIDPTVRRSGRLKMMMLLLICAAPVLASYFTYYVLRPQGRSNYGTLVTPAPLPGAAALPLRTEDGQPVDPQSLRGQWLFVVVGDGACDSHCEQLLYAQRQLREALGKEKDRIDRVWFVTGDQAVRAELRPALAQATVLHVSREALARWLQPDEGHTLEQQLYLVDPMGNWMMRFPARFEPARVRKDIERLLRASASWDLPGR